jgi:hypothetical protein
MLWRCKRPKMRRTELEAWHYLTFRLIMKLQYSRQGGIVKRIEQIQKLIFMWIKIDNWSFTKDQRQYIAEKIVFPTNIIETTEHPHHKKKMNLDTNFTCSQNYLQMDHSSKCKM